jgi:hypothetical protein
MELTRDIMAVTAVALIGVGCWCIYPPTAPIVVGVIVLGGLVYGSKRIERKQDDM